MAGPPKKRAVGEEDAENASSDGESDDSYHGQEEIQADFEGRNPEQQDFHGIKQLLGQLFLKSHINLSEISDMIIEQYGVGSVLKQSMDDDEDDEMQDTSDVFGVTTVINLSKNKEKECIKDLLSLISELSVKHSDSSVHVEINNLLTSSKKIGLLLNERFVNIPPKISDPLFSSLLGELERIKTKDNSYNFDYYIFISKLHKAKGSNDTILFANAEEEVFDKECDLSYEFNVQNEADTSVSGKWKDGDTEMIPYRKVMFVKANKLSNIVQKIKVLVG